MKFSSNFFKVQSRISNLCHIKLSIGKNEFNQKRKMFYSIFSSQIYKSTCKGYKERLFNDVKTSITEHCQNLKIQLDENVRYENIFFQINLFSFFFWKY
jgi:hypothetical protein